MSLRIPNYDLTIRELQIIKLLCEGLNYKEIAKELFIQQTTVKTHVNHIFEKLQVNDKAQLVAYVYKNGLVTNPAEPESAMGKLRKIQRALLIIEQEISGLMKTV